MTNKKPKIIFLGTPEFGAIILEKLIKAGLEPALVFTMPDKLIGRKQILTPTPVKVIAEKYGIPVLQTKKVQEFKSEIEKLNPDLIISAAFGQLFPKEILDIPKFGGLNIHPSLLPRHRGPSPIQNTVLKGDKETGVTVILMDEILDHGPIVATSKPVPITNETTKDLMRILAEIGAKLIIETIPKWLKGEVKPQIQDHSLATETILIKKEDGKIDWKKPAQEIEKQIRAFTPWPTSFAFWQKSDKLIQVKILKARVLKSENNNPVAKTLVVSSKEIGIQCGKDILVVEKLQLEGGKEMSSEEFLRGHSDFINQILA
jgi:methionyl-tRNA formyltransferase